METRRQLLMSQQPTEQQKEHEEERQRLQRQRKEKDKSRADRVTEVGHNANPPTQSPVFTRGPTM